VALARRLALLALVLVALPARAQTVLYGERGPTDGLFVQPLSAATVDDAASGIINTGGLGLMRGLQLEYFHDRELEGAGFRGDGFYLANNFFEAISAGLSFEWLVPGGTGASYRKTHLSLATSAARTFSLGVGFNLFGSDNPGLNALTSWDVGFTVRPSSWLSVAFSVRDFDRPSLDGSPLPPRFDLALGLRPVQRLTLTSDYFFLGGPPTTVSKPPRGFDNGRLGFTGKYVFAPGWGLLAGFSVPFNAPPSSPGPFLQLGLSLDFGHLGVVTSVAAAGNSFGDDTGVWNLGLRLSTESFEAPRPLARVVVVEVDKQLSHSGSPLLALLSSSSADPYEELLLGLGTAASDPSVSGVVLKFGSLPGVNLAKVEELRAAVHRLRDQGKRVVVLLTGGGDAEYYLAVSADRIYGLPTGDYLLKGFTASSVFLGEGLSKLGVAVDVVRVGEYKNAPDIFTRKDPSAAQQEVMNALLTGSMDRYVAAVSADRGVTQAAFLSVLARGVSSAPEASAERLFDGAIYPDQLERQVSALLERPVQFDEGYLTESRYHARWGTPPSIALINVFGTITEGQSQLGPFGRNAGAETVVQALRQAESDGHVAAVVVRVDSGGGDGTASDAIWHAIEGLREKKPVVVSFGDTAASGGYYLAAGADEILAEPSTITGSIGVFALKPDVSGLLGKLGIHTFSESRTPNAQLLSLTHRWTESEQRAIQEHVNAFYEIFVARVAQGRRLSKAQVDVIARGRVWSGQEALARGLIDGFGSLQEAVAHAKQRARIRADDPVDIQVFGAAPSPLISLGGAQAASLPTELQAVQLLVKTTRIEELAPLLLLPSGVPMALPEDQILVR
jgi:protease IV